MIGASARSSAGSCSRRSAWLAGGASLSGRLYLTIGFRATGLLGGRFTVAAGVVFTRLGMDAPVWQPVLGALLMGAGLGLITSALIVGLQSTVDWGRRGVVTGGAMFSRFLGQSLGAAVFGAVTNAVLLHQLRAAPADVQGQVPGTVDQVSRALQGHVTGAAEAFMRSALHASTHAVFVGLLTRCGHLSAAAPGAPRVPHVHRGSGRRPGSG